MAKKSVYELLYSFEAPDIVKSEVVGVAVTQLFKEGEVVIGEPYEREYILIDERYTVPLDYVKKTDKFPYLKKDSKYNEIIDDIKAQSILISEKEAEKLSGHGEGVKNVIEGNLKRKMDADSKAYKNGALLGLGGGIILALYFKKSLWMFGLLGIAVGGYVSHKLHKTKDNIGYEPPKQELE